MFVFVAMLVMLAMFVLHAMSALHALSLLLFVLTTIAECYDNICF